MENELVTKYSVSIERKRHGNKHSLDDLLYLIMGDDSITNAIILLITIILFGTIPLASILLFASYSGGMRWLVVLGIVTFLGIVAVYLMNRGARRRKTYDEKPEVKTEFRGQLTDLADAMERGSIGYVYSQQLLRERLCEDIIDKLTMARDMSSDEIIDKLESGDFSIVGDDILADFLRMYLRGTKGWDKELVGKGKSEERGQKFMVEVEVILDRIEEIV